MTPGVIWAAIGVIVAMVGGISTLMVFIFRLIVQNEVQKSQKDTAIDIARLEGKIEAISLATVNEEIRILREWKHDFGQKEGVYDTYGPQIDDVNEAVTAARRDLSHRITAIEVQMAAIRAIEEMKA